MSRQNTVRLQWRPRTSAPVLNSWVRYVEPTRPLMDGFRPMRPTR